MAVPAAGAPAVPARLPVLAIPARTRLLVVTPHPDDESLAAAGLIQRVLATGGEVRVVLVTSGDAFSEGVETEDGITHPTPGDYRNYGTLRERETEEAMASLGVERSHVTFLGFPDDGLCQLASKYLSAKPAFSSPYTDRDSPPTTEQIVRGVAYRGIDVRRELERVLNAFRPTLVLAPHPEDEHPDHCSTHIFTRDAIAAVWPRRGDRPRTIHYLIHYRQWPLSAEAGVGSQLRPPAGFPPAEGRWVRLPLTSAEAVAKRRALLAYSSQMLVIGRFLLAFGRGNELFIEGEPASLPECWCDGENVATERPPARRRRRPGPRR
jgi:LmbE family N-acetylglucosaminyl deacetylase